MAALAVGRGLLLPVVVLELLLGILLGPWVLGLHVTVLVGFFSDLGLGLLFFFAGYEIDVRRIAGRPLRLALAGWGVSLLLAYAIGGILAEAGGGVSLPYTGSALPATAASTPLPGVPWPDGACRSCSPTPSAASSPRRGWCSRSCTRARRSRPPRSAPSSPFSRTPAICAPVSAATCWRPGPWASSDRSC